MSNERERISTHEAAEILGVSVNFLRHQMRLGNLRIGKVIKTGSPQKEHAYLIYRDLVEKVRIGV